MSTYKISVKAERRAELIIALLMTFVLYHCAACTAVTMFYDTGFGEHYLRMALLFLPLFFLAFLRYRVKKFLVFLPLHVFAPLFGFFIGRGIGEKLVLALFTVMMLVVSVSTRTMERWKVKEDPALGMGVILLVCHFLGYYMESRLLVSVSYYELFAFVILYFLHENLRNTANFIDINKNSVNFPAGQMTVINRLLLVFFLVMLGIAMFVFPKLHLETILLPLLRGLLSVIAWLLSLFHFSRASERVEMTAEKMGNQLPFGDLEKAETALFWIILEKVLMIALALLFIAVAVGGTAYLLYRLYKGFYGAGKENADEKEFLVGEMQWLPKSLFGKKEDTDKERGGSGERIRRFYKRYVKKSFGKRESVPAALTPKELLAAIGEKKENSLDSASRERARAIYEHARYASEECAPEELEEIKRLLAGK